MKIEQLIDDEVKKQLKYKTKLVKKRQQKRNKEKLSQRDIEDLMGINRDIYIRRSGALRRK
jgi:predicted XRE-type DNA-binding protein